jgi:putative oxidoreductase
VICPEPFGGCRSSCDPITSSVVRRLFSTFAHGAPGVGLLLLRLASGIPLISKGLTSLLGLPAGGTAVLDVLMIGVGMLLVAGLWTPIAGTLLAIIAVWLAFVERANPWICALLGTLGVALALLGPGGWSVDARLFGWKRIGTRDK